MRLVSLAIDAKSLAALEEEYGQWPNLLGQALERGVRRTGQWARGKTLKAITASLPLKRSDLNGAHRFGGVRLYLAGKGMEAAATVSVTGKRIPLYRFGARDLRKTMDTTRDRGGKPGVTYRIVTGEKRRRALHAFVITLGSGHQGVFIRPADSPRLPVRELFGPSIPYVAEKQPAFQQMLRVDAGEELAKNVAHNIDFLIDGQKLPADGAGDEEGDDDV